MLVKEGKKNEENFCSFKKQFWFFFVFLRGLTQKLRDGKMIFILFAYFV